VSKIIAFPVTARAGEIQIAADALRDLHGDAANQFWRLTVKRLRQQHEESGVGRGECDRELRAFADAVFIRVAETGKPAESERAG
jgi:hypothetical protein